MSEAILSVDDLIFKIGTLVVEKMELEKKLANIAKIEEEYKGAIVREQDLRRQLDELSKRYNELVEQLNQERLKVKQLEEKLNANSDKSKKRDRNSG
jgi:chromosome segregation ATPase